MGRTKIQGKTVSTSTPRSMRLISKMFPVKLKNNSQTEKSQSSPKIAKPVQNNKKNLINFDTLTDVPAVKITEKDLEDPISFIENLYAQYSEDYGGVKLIPPQSWNPQFYFTCLGKNISYRSQIINDLSKSKPFQFEYERSSLNEFKQFAFEFEQNFNYEINPTNNEKLYWSIVDNPQKYPKIEVRYANDLSSKRYGSGFALKKECLKKGDNASLTCFNLNKLYKSPNSLFQFLQAESAHISGISYPWVYVGMLFASFCWHVEDNFMYSLNYMHQGAPKIWYIIPGKYKEQVETALRQEFAHIYNKKPNFLHDLLTCLNPLTLINKYKIPVHRVQQQEKEFVITFPKGYHTGFSNGINVAEAVNFASINWIKYYFESFKEYTTTENFKKSPYPIEWILHKINYGLNEYVFSAKNKILIKKYWKLAIEKEEKERSEIESLTKIVSKEEIVEKYDRFQCFLCLQYAYLTYYQCSGCKNKFCHNHILKHGNCKSKTKIIAFFRKFQYFHKQMYFANNCFWVCLILQITRSPFLKLKKIFLIFLHKELQCQKKDREIFFQKTLYLTRIAEYKMLCIKPH